MFVCVPFSLNKTFVVIDRPKPEYNYLIKIQFRVVDLRMHVILCKYVYMYNFCTNRTLYVADRTLSL